VRRLRAGTDLSSSHREIAQELFGIIRARALREGTNLFSMEALTNSNNLSISTTMRNTTVVGMMNAILDTIRALTRSVPGVFHLADCLDGW
jgi:hypothetical protein